MKNTKPERDAPCSTLDKQLIKSSSLSGHRNINVTVRTSKNFSSLLGRWNCGYFENLPPTTKLVIVSTSFPDIKPRYDKWQYGKKPDNCDTKGMHLGDLWSMLTETRTCAYNKCILLKTRMHIKQDIKMVMNIVHAGN